MSWKAYLDVSRPMDEHQLVKSSGFDSSGTHFVLVAVMFAIQRLIH